MRTRIGIIAAAFFYYSGLVALARWLKRHSDPCLIVLNYHSAVGGDLRKHLSYLRRHYRMLHLEEGLEEGLEVLPTTMPPVGPGLGIGFGS